MTGPAYVSSPQIADMLGINYSTFIKKRKCLEEYGFPKKDPILNKYSIRDVEAWIENRRTVPDANHVTIEGSDKPKPEIYRNEL